jgi:hypothetical protein
MGDNPPEGKTWVTVEMDRVAYDETRDVDIWELDHVRLSHGALPEANRDKAVRLLQDAASYWERAAYQFSPAGNPGESWREARHAAEAQKQATLALVDYLKEVR